MIKLNWEKVRVGQKVIIPEYVLRNSLIPAGAEYVITVVRDDTGRVEMVSSRTKTNEICNEVVTTADVIAYILGSEVKNQDPWVVIDPHKYQPKPDERFGDDFFTKDGTWIDRFHKRLFDPTSSPRLKWSMIECKWCYGKFPW